MSYRFKPAETFADGFHRIAGLQIQRVADCLDAKENIHAGVHEARKSLKRLRSLLGLYRDGMTEPAYRDIDHGLRDCARVLATTREIQAMLDSVDQLERRFGTRAPRAVLKALRARLLKRRAAAGAHRGSLHANSPALACNLDAAVQRLAQVRLPRDDFEAVRGGLERTYRDARRWQARAYERLGREAPAGSDDPGETFHEWRKHLQRHWRHMQLLSPAWPSYMRARAQVTHTISEMIGQDHDLLVLDQRLQREGRALGTAAQIKTCRALCRERQQELRQLVRCDGERLFLERPKAFGRRLEQYWSVVREDEGREGRRENIGEGV
jgi:CHAD domain-containing protein